MRAAFLETLGDPEVLRMANVPDPEPRTGEVSIQLRAAALNRRDVWIRRGRYANITLPIVLGSDGAGDVVEVGAGVDPSLVGRAVVINPSLDWGDDERVPGDRWRILGLPDFGTYAELVTVPAVAVHPIPEGLSYEQAAALPLAGLTAYRAVASRGRVSTGETVLVTGIGGGVACFALQFARQLGARVVVTSSKASKIARARELGAVGGVDHQQPGWSRSIDALVPGGPDVVIDGAGGDTFAEAVAALRPGGRLVSYGATAGPTPPFEVRRLFWKQLDVLGTTMGSPADFRAMLAFVERAHLRPVIDRVFPLEETAAAHRRMEEAEQFGKIVLRIRPSTGLASPEA